MNPRSLSGHHVLVRAAVRALVCAALIGGAAAPPPAHAATYTWVDPSSGYGSYPVWSNGANWLGGTAPPDDLLNADIVFASSVGGSRLDGNIDRDFRIHSLTFASGAAEHDFNVYSSVAGSLTLGAGGLTQNAAAQQVLLVPITLAANQTWTLADGAGAVSFKSLDTGSGSSAYALTVNAATVPTAANVFGNVLSGPITGGGSLTKTGASTYTGGTAINAGTLLVANTTGSATGTGAVQVNNGGTLAGNGRLVGAVNVAGGTLSPGSSLSPARMTLGNNLVLNPGSTLAIYLGSATNGSYGQVQLDGTLTLGGNLRVSVVNGFTLAVGQTFVILNNVGNATGANGAFANAPGGLYADAAGNRFQVDYAASADGSPFFNDVTIRVVPEPSTWLVLVLGVGLLGLILRRRVHTF